MQGNIKKAVLFIYFYMLMHNQYAFTDVDNRNKDEIIRFSSLLDTCFDIWQDSSLLSEFDATQDEWLTIHDLLIGRLTRLKHDIQTIENEQQENTVLVTDFEFIVTILQQIESNFVNQSKNEVQGIIVLTRTIREAISTLI